MSTESLDWSDELFEEIEKGNYVLVVPTEPGKQPIVATIGRKTVATVAFSGDGVFLTDHSGAEPKMNFHPKSEDERLDAAQDLLAQSPSDEPF